MLLFDTTFTVNVAGKGTIQITGEQNKELHHCNIASERSAEHDSCTPVTTTRNSLFVFLALQPIVVVFSQPGSGL